MKTKKCKLCKKRKPINNFPLNKRFRHGFSSICILCSKTIKEETNKKKIDYLKNWYLQNKEKILLRNKKRYELKKEEIRIKGKEYRLKNKEKVAKQKRNGKLKYCYGITLDQYNQMLEAQKGVCAICGLLETRKSSNGSYTLSVDHDHKTGKIRGLLCHRCNNCLGTLKDDVYILQSAINYLNGNK
jgi:hypothetical protein